MKWRKHLAAGAFSLGLAGLVGMQSQTPHRQESKEEMVDEVEGTRDVQTGLKLISKESLEASIRARHAAPQRYEHSAAVHKPVIIFPGIPVPMRRLTSKVLVNANNWETVVAQDPENSDRAMAIGLNIAYTTDGWKSYAVSPFEALTRQPAQPDYCDPGVAYGTDKGIVLSGLTFPTPDYPYINAALWIVRWDGATPSLEQILLEQNPPPKEQIPQGKIAILGDYPKVVIITDPSSPHYDTAFVSINGGYFPGRTNPTGLFIIRNLSDKKKRTITKLNGQDIGLPQPPHSGTAMGGHSILRA